MTRRTIFICDVCTESTDEYDPREWYSIGLQIRTSRGRQIKEARADVCSTQCEDAWIAEQMNEER